MNKRRCPDRSPRRGIALPVVLIFLLVITIVAVLGAKRAWLDQGITRNQLDYEIARQAADAALRDAERDVMLPRNKPALPGRCSRGAARPLSIVAVTPATFGPTCPQGQCKFSDAWYAASDYAQPASAASAAPWWPSEKGGLWRNNQPRKSCTFTGAVPIGTYTGTSPISGVARQPEYLIEHFSRNQNTQRFLRLSARGFGADVKTEVVLQSYFRFPDQ